MVGSHSFPDLITRFSLVKIYSGEIKWSDVWMLPIRCSEREWGIILPSRRVVRIAHEKRRERESLLTQQPLLSFEGQCWEVPTGVPAETWSIKTQTWLSPKQERQDYTLSLSAGNQECTVHRARQENKAHSLRESGDRYQYSGFWTEKHLLISRGYFPLPLSIGAIARPPPDITCG